MKVWNSEHIFDHSWDTVVTAVWRKYPNPITTAVTGIDILDREVDVRDGVLHSKRLLRTEWKIPGWATKLIGLDNPSFSVEFSELNPKEKTMTLKSRNLTCTNFVCVDETLVYQPDPTNPDRTVLSQSAVITVRGVPLISHMEGMMESKISGNASKGRQAMEWVINCIKTEYEDFSEKLASEYLELSQKISHEYSDLANSALRSMEEFRRGVILEEVKKAQLTATIPS